ncbi:hypothetical protein ACSV5M_11280 [Cellvibrio sp. ARAG 10.3]|uniref:hypothetical protein n=1 Tax=Cellvibrio sp. ARAG 10.3 TaxID=3451358 RepID=UPI003F450EA1
MKKLLIIAVLLAPQVWAEEAPKSADPTILLESTFIGDKEQPAISYFIPWKGNTTPDKLQWNMESKHDQTLQIVDRDVLLNSMNIYNEMNLEGTTGSAD